MKNNFLILLLIFLNGCSQKYFKNNIEITKDEYLFYKNRCERKYQEYLNMYENGGIYIGQKRHHDEYMRECMEVINGVTLNKKQSSYSINKKEASEINLFKIENNMLKISK